MGYNYIKKLSDINATLLVQRGVNSGRKTKKKQ